MRRFLWHALLVLALHGAGALVFVAGGFAPIAADKGHWPITRKLLEFAMHRSVRTQSLGIQPPAPGTLALDQAAQVRKGAGHYASGCMACHGAPGNERPWIPRSMLPEPPPLVRVMAARQWSPVELFWIVKHGIKYTGMPAWVAQDRDDEVWAMVEFLQRLPELSPDEFRRLAFGGRDVAPGACEGCHGSGGAGSDAFPRLAGLDEAYLVASLDAFASGRRQSGIMQPIAQALEAPTRRELARRYAAATAPVEGFSTPRRYADRESIARGRQLALQGDGARRIPACAQCHGPGASDRNPLYPALAGQSASYLASQLQLFARGGRGGTPLAHVMERAAAGLEPGDVTDLAAYYGSIEPE
jgi:cytochrome c553